MNQSGDGHLLCRKHYQDEAINTSKKGLRQCALSSWHHESPRMSVEMKHTSKSWQCLAIQETGCILRILLEDNRAQKMKCFQRQQPSLQRNREDPGKRKTLLRCKEKFKEED